MELIKIKETGMTRESQAEFLHFEIMKNGTDAAEAMCALAYNLKQMRDEKLFVELGFDSFEDYTVKAVGLKKSQAYDYIKALESLGEDVFLSASKLGISKVKALCAFTPEQAAEFIESNDAEAMTVKELKEKIEELTKQGEQLTLDISVAEDESCKLKKQIDGLDNEKTELIRRIKELENKPAEVSVRELTEEEKAEAIKTDVEMATAELCDKLKKAKANEKSLRDELKTAKEQAKKDIEKAKADALSAAEEKNSILSSEIEAANKKAQELEKQLKLSASPEMTRFAFYFEAAQENTKKAVELISRLDNETADKLKSNLCRYADMIKEMVK